MTGHPAGSTTGATPGTVRSRRHGAHTSETLLGVAAEVFIERGYDGTSMEDLARAAGITKSSIYHHVRGKEALLRLAVGRALDGLFAILDEPGSLRGGAVDRLEHVVHRTAEVLVAELPYVTLLLRVRGNTETERWAIDRRREFDRRVAAIVDEAVRDGDLCDDVEPRLVTRLLFGMVNSISEWYRPARGLRGPEVADAVTRIAFDGLRRH